MVSDEWRAATGTTSDFCWPLITNHLPLAWNDAEGRLTSVDTGTTATYVYNALGEWVEKDVGGTYTEYVFDKDGNPLGENNRTTWTDTWVDFQGMHIAHYENGETYFMHANHIGTTAFVTDYSGAVVEDQTHYPWGKTWADEGGIEERFAKMQHRDEETDLDPTRYRMYLSDQGRWQSPDPVRPCVHHPQEFDRYQYAANNPTNRTDPRGDFLGAPVPGYDIGLGFGCDPFFDPYCVCDPFLGCRDEFEYVAPIAVLGTLFGRVTTSCNCYSSGDPPSRYGICTFGCTCESSDGTLSAGFRNVSFAVLVRACGPITKCPRHIQLREEEFRIFGIGISIGPPQVVGCQP